VTTKPLPKFTMNDLLAELQQRMPELAQGDSLTTVEMAGRLGVSENTMRRQLRGLKIAGLVRVVTKKITTLNGRPTTVTAWVTVHILPTGGIP